MLIAEPPRAKTRRHGEALAVAIVCFAVLVAAALPHGAWRLLAVPLGLVAGATIERYRQGGREQPLSLADTPQEWKRTLTELGWRYVLAALAAAAAGVAVIALPEFRSERPDRAGEPAGSREGATTPQLPQVNVLRRPPGSTVRVRGATFTVFLPTGERWAQAMRRRQEGRDATWIAVGVDGRNLARRRFNPNALAYRLKDSRGNRYAPMIGGGTGPASLGRSGHLERGEIAQARLGFRVPRSARGLALLFEPVRDGSLQVEVPLGRNGLR